jgi:urease accessory protein
MAIIMAEAANLLRLMTWLSPAFPVGAFAYSHGLEQAIDDGAIDSREKLVGWIEALLGSGSGWNDAVLLAEAWRKADMGEEADEIAELAEAMAGSRERHMETTLQGGAFGEAMENWKSADSVSLPKDVDPVAYPVAVAAEAARNSIPLPDTLAAYLHAFTSNLVQAAVRLVPLGQRDGVASLAALEPHILSTAERAANSTLNDLGTCTIMSDIASMRHEALFSRVFRS